MQDSPTRLGTEDTAPVKDWARHGISKNWKSANIPHHLQALSLLSKYLWIGLQAWDKGISKLLWVSMQLAPGEPSYGVTCAAMQGRAATLL